MKHTYTNGNYTVRIDDKTGTKERFTLDDEFKPEFPESMDVTITSKCDGKCPFCYANCTENGKHADLLSLYMVNEFIPSLHPYTELALNGNDLTHPQLKSFLEILKAHNIIANLTVNQRHFMQNIDMLHEWTDKSLIKGLGVSLYNSADENFIKEIQKFPNAVIHTIAGILTHNDIDNLRDKNLKLLILGYKKKGKGIEYDSKNDIAITANTILLSKYLHKMVDENMFNVISFDNLALEQLDVKSLVTEDQWNRMYMGDDGTFTFFVDLVTHEFGKDSLTTKMFPIINRNIDDMFEVVRRVG